MSAELWEKLPPGFLKIGFNRWSKLDHDVRRLVVELAESQSFKCALCDATRSLVIEHDHDPEEGPGNFPTIFNIRGLTCQRCNWHLMVYEKDENGECLFWENVECIISAHQYGSYDYIYRIRVSPLIETLLELRMGSANYWRRKLFLQKFDAWFYDGERSEWRDRWKQDRSLKIETPEQFIECMLLLTKFVSEQIERDPNYRPPNQFIELVAKVQTLIQETPAIQSERLADSSSAVPTMA